MQAQAAIEITPDPDGRPPSRLIQASYFASASALVVLILHGVKASAVDAVLDEVVPLLPLTIPGVSYVDAADEAAVLQAASAAGRVFVATEWLRRLAAHDLRRAGAVRSIRSALKDLGFAGGQPGPVPIGFRPAPARPGASLVMPELDAPWPWRCRALRTAGDAYLNRGVGRSRTPLARRAPLSLMDATAADVPAGARRRAGHNAAQLPAVSSGDPTEAGP